MCAEIGEINRKQSAEKIGTVKGKLDLACLFGIPKSIEVNGQ